MLKSRRIKNFKMKVLSIVVIIAMLSIQLEPLSTMMAAQGSLNYSSGSKTNPIYDPYYDYASGIYNDTLGGSTAYCLDYGRELPSGVLSFKGYASPEVTAVMIYGYPTVSASSLGVNSDYEASLATKMAMWMVAQAKGENTKSIMNFNIDIIQPTAGYEQSTPRAIAAAKVLANKAMTNPYTAKLTLQITGVGAKLSHIGNKIVAGPYKVTTTGSGAKTTKISLTNAPASAITTDAAGTQKTTFAIGEEIYVKINDTEATGDLTLNAQADGEKNVGAKYGNDLYYTQAFAVVVKEPVSLVTNVKVAWTGLDGNVELLKVDQNNNKIQGVTFELRDLSGKVLKTAVTGADGYVRFSSLPVGEYRLVEVKAPDGYIMADKPIVVTVKPGETFKTTCVNKKTNGGLKIIKTDSDNKPIQGVEFQILNSQKRLVDTITTDANGIASIYDLPDGTYYYKESKAPSYVVIDSTINEFKISGNIVTKNIVNQVIKGSLKIVKTDSDKKPLQGVKFQILDSSKNVVETITTDANGIANSSKLNKGTYYYKEIEAPASVVIDSKEYEFKINTQNEVVTKNVVNQIVKGGFKIIKVDENEKPLQGVKFNILDSNSKVIQTITTDANGVAESKELEKGNYFYQEVSAPAGIIVDDTKYPFVVDGSLVTIKMVNKYIKGKLEITKVDNNNKPIQGVKFDILNSNKEVVETLTTDANGKATSKNLMYGTYFYKETYAPDKYLMDTKTYEFKITQNNQVVAKTVENKIIEGSLKIIKVDENEKPLQGVKFKIYDSNDKVIQTIVTDANGVAVSDELEKGVYYYQEVDAPEGIIIDNTKYKFTVADDLVVIKMVNKYVKGKLEITKVDNDNNPIEGVKFDILNSNKEVVETLTTDVNGKATSKNLVYGKYYYKEVEAPSNVIMDTKEYEFKITQNEQIVAKTIVNLKLTGALKVLKLDKDTKQPIAGVRFEVLNSNKEVIATIITDENGIAKLDNLVKGTYFFKEVKAPDKYIMDSTTYEFEINKSGQIIEKTVYNETKKLPITGGFINNNMIIIFIISLLCTGLYIGSKFVFEREPRRYRNKILRTENELVI